MFISYSKEDSTFKTKYCHLFSVRVVGQQEVTIDRGAGAGGGCGQRCL